MYRVSIYFIIFDLNIVKFKYMVKTIDIIFIRFFFIIFRFIYY